MPRLDLSDDERMTQAARHGDAASLALALAAGADPKADDFVLQSAAENGHAECVKLLLPFCDPKAADSLALRAAAVNGHAEIVGLLLAVSDPKAAGPNGLDSAACARRRGQVDVAAMIEAFIEAQEISASFPSKSKKLRSPSAL